MKEARKDRAAYLRDYMRNYRAEVLSEDEEHKAKEKARKAAWYAANKEKKAAAQRRYRAKLKAAKLKEIDGTV